MQDNLFAKLPIALIKSGLLAELKPSSVVVYNVLLSYADFNTYSTPHCQDKNRSEIRWKTQLIQSPPRRRER